MSDDQTGDKIQIVRPQRPTATTDAMPPPDPKLALLSADRLREIVAISAEGWWTHEGGIYIGKDFASRKLIAQFADKGNFLHVSAIDIGRAHAVINAINAVPALLKVAEAAHRAIKAMADVTVSDDEAHRARTIPAFEDACGEMIDMLYAAGIKEPE